MGIALREPEEETPFEGSYAGRSDYAFCKRIHRQHGSSYYFATARFRPEVRRRTHAVYAFVRVPDEWVDNPGHLSLEQRSNHLRDWRTQLIHGMDGVYPTHPALRAFCDTLRETEMPLDEPMHFLDAMQQDLVVGRYETYEDLKGYMRGSAVAVGQMMNWILGSARTEPIRIAAAALSEAMQLTNFLRDVGEDAARGRIYLPLEDLASFGVRESDILDRRLSTEFLTLMRFEVARARALYAKADRGIPMLPHEAQRPVLLARVLYEKILDKIEQNKFDVFNNRARTSRLEKIVIAAKTWMGTGVGR